MGFDKDQVVPAQQAKTKKKGNGVGLGDVTWGHLRFQDYTKGGTIPANNWVHIHDDPKNLVFVWDDVESFRNTLKSFLAERHRYKNDYVVFRGKKQDEGGSSHFSGGNKPADWVWHFDSVTSRWEFRIEPAGAQGHVEYSNDPAVDFLTDWMKKIG